MKCSLLACPLAATWVQMYPFLPRCRIDLADAKQRWINWRLRHEWRDGCIEYLHSNKWMHWICALLSGMYWDVHHRRPRDFLLSLLQLHFHLHRAVWAHVWICFLRLCIFIFVFWPKYNMHLLQDLYKTHTGHLTLSQRALPLWGS